ncbi:MAG: hypothetical protein C4550_00915 [Nitrospiraceae bacterium]|nr:MAG: hypothetical protein C4550_00915 [Nitrospiraceae bacterium]
MAQRIKGQKGSRGQGVKESKKNSIKVSEYQSVEDADTLTLGLLDFLSNPRTLEPYFVAEDVVCV